jgi:hypothetical protein
MRAAKSSLSGETPSFSDTLTDILDRLEYRRVSIEDQLDPVYRLRYEAYRREEFIPANDQQIVQDEFDDLPNAQCFGVYIDGNLVSSLRFHHITPEFRHSPSHSVFTERVDAILDQGHGCIDPGRFTADYQASLLYPAIPFLTLRIVVMASHYYGAKYCFSSVRPEHTAFYRRVFRSVPFSEPRFYHGLSFPMILMACDVPEIYPNLLERFPFFMSTEKEREMMFGRGAAKPTIIPSTARVAQRMRALERMSA